MFATVLAIPARSLCRRSARILQAAPLAEVTRYKASLDSITQGNGSYTMEFSHYDQVPGNVQQNIVKNAKLAADEEE